LIQAREDDRAVFKDSFDADTVVVFKYSYKENQYFVAKRLGKLLGSKPGAVVCDNAITLQACRLFSTSKTVFHLLHDYYYVNQNIEFGNNIDVAVAHSVFFADCVFASNPKEFADRTFYIPYGVRQYEQPPLKQNNENLKLVFLGRLEKTKGVDALIEIEKILQRSKIDVEWTVIGKGSLESILKGHWQSKDNIVFLQPENTDAVYEALQQQDVFVFPTMFEGTPVSILEAISNALVTIVSDLPGGIREVITDDIGFKVPVNDIEAFAQAIQILNNDRGLLKSMQDAAWAKAKQQYDIHKNADRYFELFAQNAHYKRRESTKKAVPFSRLDKKQIPNKIVQLLRSL